MLTFECKTCKTSTISAHYSAQKSDHAKKNHLRKVWDDTDDKDNSDDTDDTDDSDDTDDTDDTDITDDTHDTDYTDDTFGIFLGYLWDTLGILLW